MNLTTPEDGEVFMSSDLSVADASPPRRPRPRVPSSADYKKLVRLALPKVKLGSDSSTVKKLCLSMVKTHKLSVSDDECTRVYIYMRGTLEVALKAYLHPSYQHCTDEAQKAETILFAFWASSVQC